MHERVYIMNFFTQDKGNIHRDTKKCVFGESSMAVLLKYPNKFKLKKGKKIREESIPGQFGGKPPFLEERQEKSGREEERV